MRVFEIGAYIQPSKFRRHLLILGAGVVLNFRGSHAILEGDRPRRHIFCVKRLYLHIAEDTGAYLIHRNIARGKAVQLKLVQTARPVGWLGKEQPVFISLIFPPVFDLEIVQQNLLFVSHGCVP